MTQNKNNIIIKTIYEERRFATSIDVSKLNPKNNDDFVITIIDESLFSRNKIEILPPREFKLVKKDFIEIKPEEENKFNLKNKKNFKFDYKRENNDDQLLFFVTESDQRFIIRLYSTITDKGQNLIYDKDNTQYSYFKIQRSGTYYIELDYLNNEYIDQDEIFSIFITGNIIDKIDLSQRMYYKNYKRVKIGSEIKPNPSIYKVNNLKKDSLVCFTYRADNNPFEVCNDNIGECSKKIDFYKFLHNYNYTIYINFVDDWSIHGYSFDSFFFFPILEDTLENIKVGYYNSSLPKIYIININLGKQYYCMAENSDNKLTISETEEEEITLDNLINIHLTKALTLYNRINNNYNSKIGLVILIPDISENPSVFIVNNLLNIYKPVSNYFFSSEENAIIFLYSQYYGKEESIYYKNPLRLYNSLSVITSSEKNLKITDNFEEKEYKDFINQNYYSLYIYLNKAESGAEITTKCYEPRYSFFIVADNNEFKYYWNQLVVWFSLPIYYKIEDLSILRFVVNSDMNEFYEFFNFYFFDMKGNKNFYIKQYYGNTELYEYNSELIKDRDYSILTKPRDINVKNKTSILDKMITLKDNKLIFGYLGQNSLLDIYFEVDNDSTDITMTYLNNLVFGNTAKYLKKDIVYTLKFKANHLAKLEPGFNAEVTIYNDDGEKIILTPQKPTGEFYGNNYKVKSNNDAMIYFYGRSNLDYEQILIDPKQVGKNVEIKAYDEIYYVISFSFKGYSPTEEISYLKNFYYLKNGGNIYIENIYDKIKTKLVEGEYLYFYYLSYDDKIDIKYSPNLNHKNNIYSFLTIPANSNDKTLIINNINKEEIRYQVNFCESPNTIIMYYQEPESSEEKTLEFNNETRFIDHYISKKAYKLRFKSTNDFVFSYSFIDFTDKESNDFERFINEREELFNLTIENITKKYPDDHSSDIFTIKFRPNYKNSSTIYIVVIAPKEGTNTLENFKNPCY